MPTETHHGRVSKEAGKQKMEKEGRNEGGIRGPRPGDVVSEWANLVAMSDET